MLQFRASFSYPATHGLSSLTYICKGVCTSFRVSKDKELGYYALGKKFCTTCDVWLGIHNKYCICCGSQFRTRPRDRRYKARLDVMSADSPRVVDRAIGSAVTGYS